MAASPRPTPRCLDALGFRLATEQEQVAADEGQPRQAGVVHSDSKLADLPQPLVAAANLRRLCKQPPSSV